MTMSDRVWLITGTSSGIGRELALCALRRGDKVIATTRARSMPLLADLEAAGAAVAELDVTAPLEELHGIAARAVEIYGKVDVLVNNAGSYATPGAIEEVSPEETLSQFNVHVFGALNVARAFLPYMRQRRSGLIIWNGSLMGWRGAPSCGIYAGTKHAIRGLSETLDMEVRPLGIRSIVIEPGYFRTNLITEGHRPPYVNRIPDYKPAIEAMDEVLIQLADHQPGDTRKLGDLIVDLARGDGAARDKPLPFALPIGPDCRDTVRQVCGEMLTTLGLWDEAISATNISIDH